MIAVCYGTLGIFLKFTTNFRKLMKKFSFAIAKITIMSFFMLMVTSAVLPYFSVHAVASPPVANPPVANTPPPVTATANDNALVDTMCNALKLVTGNAGKAFAAFAIISLGIGFFTGKVSWGLMIGVAMGIAAMFGAPTIVAVLSGKDAYSCGS